MAPATPSPSDRPWWPQSLEIAPRQPCFIGVESPYCRTRARVSIRHPSMHCLAWAVGDDVAEALARLWAQAVPDALAKAQHDAEVWGCARSSALAQALREVVAAKGKEDAQAARWATDRAEAQRQQDMADDCGHPNSHPDPLADWWLARRIYLEGRGTRCASSMGATVRAGARCQRPAALHPHLTATATAPTPAKTATPPSAHCTASGRVASDASNPSNEASVNPPPPTAAARRA